MSYAFSSFIQIGALKLTFLNELEIRSTWKEMTSTAIIKIPKKVTFKKDEVVINDLTKVFSPGQKVVIKLGYNGVLITHFVGYVNRFSPSVPLEIKCEDEMWQMKRKKATQKIFSANAKLSDLINYLVPGIEFDVFDTKLGANYSCLNEKIGTVAQALKKIETTFGLKSFFRLVPDSSHPDGARQVLVIGKMYSSKDLVKEKPVIYKLGENTKSDSLRYIYAEDNPIQIKGISKMPDGKDITSDYPQIVDNASTRTRTYYGIDLATLKEHIKADYLKANVDRYEGEIIGFAVPFIRHGLAVNIIDNYYIKRNVLYFVDQVVVKVSKSLGVQLISSIGYVVNDETRGTFK